MNNHILEQLAKRLGGEYSNGQAYVPGPGHSSSDRGLALSIGKNGKLLVHSHHGDDYQTCIEYLSAYIDGAKQSNVPARPLNSNTNVDAIKIGTARDIWDQALPLTGTCAASRYLKSRSLGAPYRSSMRFHPNLSTMDRTGRKRPAVVCRISHAYGKQFCGVHITFIEVDGSGKAKDVEITKRVFGKVSEGGIWPDTHDAVIVITEGVESALSAERQFGVPAVAAISANGLRSLYVPSTVRTAFIVADHDKSGVGEQAALMAAQRLMQQGIQCVVFKPAWEGKDANDLQQFEPINNLIDVNRKAKPLLDAAVYGNGVSLVPVAPFSDPFIKFGVLKAVDPSNPEWPRMAAYFDLLQCASLDDEVYDYAGHQIMLRTGDILAAQDYLATRWNASRNTVRSFLNGLAERGLISMRRPETPAGKVIGTGRDGRIPDVLELPKIPLVPVVDKDGFSLRKSGRKSTKGFCQKSTNGKQAEHYSTSMGYQNVPTDKPPMAKEQNLPQSISTVEWENSFGFRSGSNKATKARAPVDPSWIAWMPPSTNDVPWYGVPPELRQSSTNKPRSGPSACALKRRRASGNTDNHTSSNSQPASNSRRRKRVLAPKGGAV